MVIEKKIKRKTHLILAPAPYLPGQKCLLLCDRKMPLHIFVYDFCGFSLVSHGSFLLFLFVFGLSIVIHGFREDPA